MSLSFKWELPGGKLEPGEDSASCLYRETMEEMNLEIRILQDLKPVDRFFREKHYRMLPFVCEVTGGEMIVHEHEQAVWCPIDSLFELDWAPAEEMVLREWVETLGDLSEDSHTGSTENFQIGNAENKDSDAKRFLNRGNSGNFVQKVANW